MCKVELRAGSSIATGTRTAFRPRGGSCLGAFCSKVSEGYLRYRYPFRRHQIYGIEESRKLFPTLGLPATGKHDMTDHLHLVRPERRYRVASSLPSRGCSIG
jgi:hypothetical protein